jgi:hypothetical protein
LWQGGAPLAGWGTLGCGDRERVLALPAGEAYQFRLSAASGEGLQFVQYNLTVENLP